MTHVGVGVENYVYVSPFYPSILHFPVVKATNFTTLHVGDEQEDCPNSISLETSLFLSFFCCWTGFPFAFQKTRTILWCETNNSSQFFFRHLIFFSFSLWEHGSSFIAIVLSLVDTILFNFWTSAGTDDNSRRLAGCWELKQRTQQKLRVNCVNECNFFLTYFVCVYNLTKPLGFNLTVLLTSPPTMSLARRNSNTFFYTN